jgi:mannose-6-phosphate isomerase class I
MTIDEAIAHYEWAAGSAIGEVADESKQMAEWLRQARDAESRVQELEAENTKLRKLAQEACEMTGNLLDDLSDLDKELGIEP